MDLKYFMIDSLARLGSALTQGSRRIMQQFFDPCTFYLLLAGDSGRLGWNKP